jgi:uncharacterized membrane protein YfcA
MSDSRSIYLLLCVAAVAAGAVNSIAGGGTLLTFPSLLTVVPSVAANATSTVSLVPGSLASGWAYRREMQAARRWLMLLIGPSLVGGGVGALLVTRLEQYFDAMVPWLLLTAATLFLFQPAIVRFTGVGRTQAAP